MNFSEFCGEPFWELDGEILNSTNPRFSNCFEQVGCTLVPCAYLIILSFPYYLRTRGNLLSHSLVVSKIFKLKLITTAFLCLFAWTNLIKNFADLSMSVIVPPVNLISHLALGISMAFALLLTQFDRNKGVHSSGLLTGYWFLLLLLWMFIFKAKVDMITSEDHLPSMEVFRCVLFFLSYSGVVINIVLCCFSDKSSAILNSKSNESERDTKSENIVVGAPSPELEATFISKLFFWWMTKLMITGYKRPLVDSDLWRLNEANRSSYVTKRFFETWNKDIVTASGRINPSFTKNCEDAEKVVTYQPTRNCKQISSLVFCLVRVFGRTFLLSTLLRLFAVLLEFVSPLLLSALIEFVSRDFPQWYGYSLAVGLFIVAFTRNILSEQYFHACFVVGLRIRTALISAVYRKALILSNSSRKQNTTGEIVNLMSVDAERFVEVTTFINLLWSVPLTISLSIYFLWEILGPSVLAGFAVMLVIFPLNVALATKIRIVELHLMNYKDERMKLLSEIFNGIKVLKMYAWEMLFKNKVVDIWRKEIGKLRLSAYLDAFVTFTFLCAPILVSITTFAVYILSDHENVLDARKIFVSLSLFEIMRMPLSIVPLVVMSLMQANVSLNRLQAFLDLDELDPDNVERGAKAAAGENAISLQNGSFTWEKGEESVLSNINMSVKEGSLVAIVGQVGCGKSSLISALLGDMEKTDGNVSVKGSVAYVPQQPWIQNMSVRDNITFGKSLNAKKYQDTVEACELIVDFDMLPAGDDTEIGEKGINLSGGQKQRVSIARAVYQDADTYLFDDPLSAVDAHVGKNIFDHVIGPNGCLKEKTRVLATHGLAFLPQVDRILVMDGGCISEAGTYQELLSKNGAFADFVRNYAPVAADTGSDGDVAYDQAMKQENQLLDVRPQGRKSITLQAFTSTCDLHQLKGSVKHTDQCSIIQSQTIGQELVKEEKAETGNIKLSVFVAYMKSIGYSLASLILLLFFLQTAAQIFSSIWLSEWSTDPINQDGTQNGTGVRLTVYGSLGITQAVAVLIATFLSAYGTINAALSLHNSMLYRIFRAPTSFFDTTPLGRILNRFSNDMYLIEDPIPMNLNYILQETNYFIAIVFCIVYSTPLITVPIILLLVLYCLLQRFYVRTSRQLARIESISRSPIYSHFSETVTGASSAPEKGILRGFLCRQSLRLHKMNVLPQMNETDIVLFTQDNSYYCYATMMLQLSKKGASSIRAFAKERTFTRQIEKKVDVNQMSHYPKVVSARWLAIFVQLIGNLFVLLASIFAVASKGFIHPGLVGLSVSYAMQTTEILSWVIKEVSDLESDIVSVERVLEYTKIEQEAALIEDDRPSKDWPSKGEVQFKGYGTRYRRGLDLVVEDISFHVKGGEKIGIVGRTGAGKSSLTLALFRILEPELGSITIDGKNISKIGLQDLRSKLSIIPQDPVLFAGTLRVNLDPFDNHSDDALWNVLEQSHLKNLVWSLPGRLEHVVTEGGGNLSVGQRQLVCLARSLLRRSKILILDEATAAIDLETDRLIQETIRVEFEDSTVLTIAHRINTIMDSTRILVMDAGKVAEFDTPSNLLKKEGIFYGMTKDAGLV